MCPGTIDAMGHAQHARCDGDAGTAGVCVLLAIVGVALVGCGAGERVETIRGQPTTSGPPSDEEQVEARAPVETVVEGARLGTGAEHEHAENGGTGIRSLAWLDATTVVSVGDEVALWRGEPPALVARGQLPGPTASVDARAAQIVAPCGAAVCVWSSENMRVRRRLSCRRGTAEADGAVVDEGGRWVAGHCRSRADPELGEAAVQSCVWDARSGRRVRCVETLLPGWASQELAFAPGAELLAVTTSNGVELLEPPGFGARSMLPAEVAHDAHVPLAWSPRGDRLAVLNTSEAAIYDVGSGVASSFEVVGEPLSAAFSPDGEELAVLYREGLVVHAIDGTVRARAGADEVGGGRVRWSHDGTFLAVEWIAGDPAGFDVYRRAGLQHVLGGQRQHGDAPTAWHRERNTLAYSLGSVIQVRDFSAR
jgi:hypothetical protein